MKPKEKPQRVQREKLFREKIKGMEILYDLVESGKSMEQLAIDLDISAAGGALSESSHEVWRGALDVIRSARQAGADRNEVITYLQDRAKELIYRQIAREGQEEAK